MWEKLKDIVFTVTHPSFWVMKRPYSEAWDGVVRRIIDEDLPVQTTTWRTVRVNGVSIWVGDYPYSYATPFDNALLEGRPSRRTIHKFRSHTARQQVEKIHADIEAERHAMLADE